MWFVVSSRRWERALGIVVGLRAFRRALVWGGWEVLHEGRGKGQTHARVITTDTDDLPAIGFDGLRR